MHASHLRYVKQLQNAFRKHQFILPSCFNGGVSLGSFAAALVRSLTAFAECVQRLSQHPAVHHTT